MGKYEASRLLDFIKAKVEESRHAGTRVEVLRNQHAEKRRLDELRNQLPGLKAKGRRGQYVADALNDLFAEPPLADLKVHVATCGDDVVGAASTFSSHGPDGQPGSTNQIHWVGALETPEGTGTALMYSIAVTAHATKELVWLRATADGRAFFPAVGFIEGNEFMYWPEEVVNLIASIR